MSPRALKHTRTLLAFEPPLNWNAALTFIAARAIPGVESVQDGRYRRSIRTGGGGLLEVALRDGTSMRADLWLPPAVQQEEIVTRLRWQFDLDTRLQSVSTHLQKDPRLAARLAALPGLRLVRAWDAFELSIRAILGQQVSVAAATTLAGRLVEAYGEPLPTAGTLSPYTTRLFPEPEALATADVAGIGMPKARAAAISAVAAAVVEDPALLTPGGALGERLARLRRLPGIGDWTAHYIALRALGHADAFPAADLGLRRAWGAGGNAVSTAAMRRAAERWRPWRGYAAMYLWLAAPAETGSSKVPLSY